ncbi:hemolysin family protein [Micrococcus sp.]|uniref:hemolysin family protein n=1 Tax=Micrococcus sp. TaxID=1271 RepID=UPI002A91FC2C|nr:hemolysin family protein [Micrococcus sp.]MDY6055435.1 hemolysin family protein [Micrococcus sp.]
MVTPVALLALFVVFIALTWLLALAESAFTHLPRRDAEDIARQRPDSPILDVTADLDAHLGALRVWRFLSEAFAAMCLTAGVHVLTDSVWPALAVAVVVLVAAATALGVWSPRPIGSRNEAAVAGRTAGLVHGLRRALGPVGDRLGQDRRRSEAQVADEDDFQERHLREVVARAHDADVLDDSEAELIESVFSMTDTLVRAVMVPRTDVVTIDVDHTLGQAMDLFLRSGNSRVPVIGEDADDVRGMLYLKDVTRALHHEGADPQDPVSAMMREARFVPESKSVAALLPELQRESTHVAIVVDEYGGTAGLVTLEDLIEEIVGEIYDEDETPDRPEVEPLEPGVWSVDARMGIADFGEQFGLDLEEELDDVDTVGGLLAKHLGRVPIRGSQVQVQGVQIVAETLEPRRNRVDRLRVTERPPQGDLT